MKRWRKRLERYKTSYRHDVSEMLKIYFKIFKMQRSKSVILHSASIRADRKSLDEFDTPNINVNRPSELLRKVSLLIKIDGGLLEGSKGPKNHEEVLTHTGKFTCNPTAGQMSSQVTQLVVTSNTMLVTPLQVRPTNAIH